MRAYLDIVEEILSKGKRKSTRTGYDKFTISGVKFEHDMSDGFPLLTTKKINYKNVASELEFFIKGITDKKWLQDRGNPIWNQWCSSDKMPYAPDEETKRRMAEERELGPIYGWQWRHKGANYRSYDIDYNGEGEDQLVNLVTTLLSNPDDTRMIVDAWGTKEERKRMALPPCHYQFQVLVTDGKLDLLWAQRSVDTMLGLPYNIASYATLLSLLAEHSKFKPGKLVGFLGDTHIYDMPAKEGFMTHVEGARLMLSRQTKRLPRLVNARFTSLFDWEYSDATVESYDFHPFIKMEVAV